METDKEKIRKKSGEQDDRILLLEKGKRGALNVLFGRTMLILVMLAVQILFLVLAFRRLQEYVAALYAVQLLVFGGLAIHLVNRSSNAQIKLSWMVVMALIPALGVALYVFVETDVGHRMLNRRLSDLIDQTRKYVPDQQERLASLEADHRELASLGRYTWAHGNFPVYEHTAVEYLSSGEASLESMLEALESAKDFIFLEFFIVDEGYMWGRVLKILEEKARQGVEVRVMYDGTCALFRLPYRYPEMMRTLGIKCKMFAPLRPFMSTYYNNRDHRKILVVDGRVAYTGGVNLADEYINRKPLFGHWKDVSIRFEGEAVRSFTLMFLQMWNINEPSDNYERYLSPAFPAPAFAPGYVLPYGDSPLDDERVGEMMYMDVLNRAERYVHIMTPYLIIDGEMTTALTFAAKRGVEVKVILPHIPDKKYAFALAKTHYRELLQAGVKIYEYTPGFVHAKLFVSDDEKAIVGTLNLDYRSLYLHFECAAYICDMPAVAAVEDDFIDTLSKCQEIRLEDLKKQKLLTRAAGALLKVLAPLM